MRRKLNTQALMCFAAATLLLGSCIPANVSRIGPPRARKAEDCEIRVLPPGASPERPWVDIGVVLLENCQEYHVGLCRKWLVQKACELGGEVAYLPNPESPKDAVNNIRFRVLVAVYAVDANTPFTPTGAGCAEPARKPDADTDTDTVLGTDTETEPPEPVAEPERCLEQ